MYQEEQIFSKDDHQICHLNLYLFQKFSSMGLNVLGVASIAAGLNFIVTIINMRAPGMSMMKMPVFTWMTFITSILIVLALPILGVAGIQMTHDSSFLAT